MGNEALTAALEARSVRIDERDERAAYSLDVGENPLGVWVARASWCIKSGARANHWHRAYATGATRDGAELALLEQITATSCASPPTPCARDVAFLLEQVRAC